MPAEKYTWRPTEGRSLGRRSLHPHYRGKLWHCRGTGYRPTSRHRSQGPYGPLRWQKVLQARKDSFGHFRNAIVALNDADADKPQRCSTARPPCADLSSWSRDILASTSPNPSPTRAWMGSCLDGRGAAAAKACGKNEPV